MDRNLHETDFYSWTARQAAALRRGAFAEADIANIVEEMEASGRSEKSALESSYAVLCTHLLKAIHQPGMTTPSWQIPTDAPFSRQEAEDESFLPGRLGRSKDELDAGTILPRRGRSEEP